MREETRLPPPPQGFSQIRMWIVLEATIDSITSKISDAYRTLNHRPTIETRQRTTTLISKDTILCHHCSYTAVENEAHFVLECPLYIVTPLELSFHHYLRM